jgi:hypothetical protein
MVINPRDSRTARHQAQTSRPLEKLEVGNAYQFLVGSSVNET